MTLARRITVENMASTMHLSQDNAFDDFKYIPLRTPGFCIPVRLITINLNSIKPYRILTDSSSQMSEQVINRLRGDSKSYMFSSTFLLTMNDFAYVFADYEALFNAVSC